MGDREVLECRTLLRRSGLSTECYRIKSTETKFSLDLAFFNTDILHHMNCLRDNGAPEGHKSSLSPTVSVSLTRDGFLNTSQAALHADFHAAELTFKEQSLRKNSQVLVQTRMCNQTTITIGPY